MEKTSAKFTSAARTGIGSTPQFELSSRPRLAFSRDVVAAWESKVPARLRGNVFLTAASQRRDERFRDICRKYEVPTCSANPKMPPPASPRSAQESAAMLQSGSLREGVTFPDARLRFSVTPSLFDVTPGRNPQPQISHSGFFGDFAELKPGDYVPRDHGIGQFEGLFARSNRRTQSGGILCSCDTPTMRASTFPSNGWTWCKLPRSRRHASALDRLGGTVWNARKTRAANPWKTWPTSF